MNLLTRSIRWSTLELGLFQLAFVSFGLIAGALPPELWRGLLTPLVVTMSVCGAGAAALWLTRVRAAGPAPASRA